MQVSLNDIELSPWPDGWVVHDSVDLVDQAATDRLAQYLSERLVAGDVLLFQGQLGAGKSHLARALIRSLLNDEMADVPSPTFTLVQTYFAKDIEIWHADLYRLSDPQELWELGLEEAYDSGLCVIEWPDRFAPDWPDGAVCLRLDAHPRDENRRALRLVAPKQSALAHRLALDGFK